MSTGSFPCFTSQNCSQTPFAKRGLAAPASMSMKSLKRACLQFAVIRKGFKARSFFCRSFENCAESSLTVRARRLRSWALLNSNCFRDFCGDCPVDALSSIYKRLSFLASISQQLASRWSCPSMLSSQPLQILQHLRTVICTFRLSSASAICRAASQIGLFLFALAEKC